MASIREADFDDLAGIIELGVAMHSTCNFAHMRFDRREFGEFLVHLISTPRHVVFVAEEDGALVGATLCSVFKSYMGPDLMAAEHACFVLPEHRKGSLGLRMVKQYVEWAKEQGARRITAGNSAGAPDSGYVALTERAGFERAGSLMYQNV